jgi:hypothetical protein
MNAIEIFILILLTSFFVISFLICLNNTLYCFVFEHEDWKLWKHYIKIEKEFVWNSENGRFEIPNTCVHAHIWEDDLCSIHWKGDCLCTYDKYHSKKMAKLLMTKVK